MGRRLSRWALSACALLLLAPAAGQASPVAEERYVRHMYDAALERDPDAAGLEYWRGRLAANCVPEAEKLARQFLTSQEFKRLYPIVTEPTREPQPVAPYERTLYAAINAAYRTLLRWAESSGMSYWYWELHSGRRTWTEVVAAITQSAEGKRVAGRVCAAASTSGVPPAPVFWRKPGSCPHAGPNDEGVHTRPTAQGDAVRFVFAIDERQPDGTWVEVQPWSTHYGWQTGNPFLNGSPYGGEDAPSVRRMRGYAESIHGKRSATVAMPAYRQPC